MIWFALTIASIAAATWIGAIVFQSAVVAPRVFTDLETESAGRLLRQLFPRFFRVGAICGVIIALAFFCASALASWPLSFVLLAICGVAVACLALIALRMVPHINAARDAGPAAAARFSRLHRWNVILTLASMAAAAVVLATVARLAAAGV